MSLVRCIVRWVRGSFVSSVGRWIVRSLVRYVGRLYDGSFVRWGLSFGRSVGRWGGGVVGRRSVVRSVGRWVFGRSFGGVGGLVVRWGGESSVVRCGGGSSVVRSVKSVGRSFGGAVGRRMFTRWVVGRSFGGVGCQSFGGVVGRRPFGGVVIP